MTEAIIYQLLMVLAGGYFLYRNITYFRDEAKLRSYLQTSRKGKLWVEKMGIEKTVNLTKKYFLPLGTFVAVLLLGTGLWNLTKII